MLRITMIAVTLAIAGDVIIETLGVPVPGSALGMLMLTAYFAWQGGVNEHFGRLFDFASPYFPLFFVPAAVGIVDAGALLASSWLHVALAIVVGTAVTIATTGLLCRFLLNLCARPKTAR